MALGGFAGRSGHGEEFTVFGFQLPVEEKRVISDQISAIRRQEERDISDQRSAIRRQEKAYAEGTESAEFAEKRRGTEVSARKSPPFAKVAKDGAPSGTWMGGIS